MEHIFIVNPFAGKKEGLKIIPEIEKYFSARNQIQYKIIITEYKGNATEIAREYANKNGCSIYAVGGDGTVCEVLNGMINSQNNLGIIPCGTGNDLTKRIEEKYEVEFTLSNVIEGRTLKVDALKINDRYLLNVGSLGFDAEVLRSFLFLKEKTPIKGKLLYNIAIVGNIIRTLTLNKKYSLKIEIDGKYIEGDYFLLAFANGRYYGGRNATCSSS